MSERAESYDELRAEIDRLKAENEKYHQAIGLATTALPSMQIDPNDPVGMMHKVVAQITALRAEIERMDKENRVLHAERDELQSRIDRIYQSAAINWLVDDYAQTVKRLRAELGEMKKQHDALRTKLDKVHELFVKWYNT